MCVLVSTYITSLVTSLLSSVNLEISFLTVSLKLFFKILAAAAAKSLQSCLTPCDPIDGSQPGSPVPGILQEGALEGVAISFSNA